MSPFRTALALALVASLAACGGGRKANGVRSRSFEGDDDRRQQLPVARDARHAQSFMPLVQTDSNGGVVVTDWYVNPQRTDRADQDHRLDPRPGPARRRGPCRGAARGQPRRRLGQRGPVDASTPQKLEDIILTKARDLRRASVTG